MRHLVLKFVNFNLNKVAAGFDDRPRRKPESVNPANLIEKYFNFDFDRFSKVLLKTLRFYQTARSGFNIRHTFYLKKTAL